jgi:hypothetical protein
MFKATPIREGLSILMARRIQETAELQSKTEKLLRNFMKENTAETTLQEEEEEQFVMVPEKEALIKRRALAVGIEAIVVQEFSVASAGLVLIINTDVVTKKTRKTSLPAFKHCPLN